jgi:hypothetical protein
MAKMRQTGKRGRREPREGWPRAEAELEIATRRINDNNATAALAYDHNQTEFAKQADVAGKAKAAKMALEGPEGEEVRKAEAASRKGSKHSPPP